MTRTAARPVLAAIAAGLVALTLSGCKPGDLKQTVSSPTTSRVGHVKPADGPPTSTASTSTTTTTTTATTTPTTTAMTTPTTTATTTPTTTAPPTTTTMRTSTTTPPTPAPTSPTTPSSAGGKGCSAPVFSSSKPDAMFNNGGYIVHNNMWNAEGYKVSQRIDACSFRLWDATATADNSRGDGAVKTYPNVHKDYHDWSTGAEPKLSSFGTLRSTFAGTGPGVGIYDVAYDIWLNGVPGNREVMIWTENHGQTPSGSVVAKGIVLSGITWDLFATGDNGYLAFVPRQTLSSGSLDLRAMLNFLVQQGRMPVSSTLGQIDFGVEIVSTNGAPATFRFSDFSVTDS